MRQPLSPNSHATPPDADLAKAAQRGEKRAFVEIVARHQATVCGIAYGILGDFAASEDAAQEAFLTAWRKIHDLRQPERLKPWLSQIARTSALGHLRRRHPERSLDDAADRADTALLPDEAAASDEEAALVRDALAKLPESFRVPLVLFYREGQSVRMVAEALEISEDAVKQRLSRGRDMLRDRMSGLIETVLTRTKPTAVFTMMIAAAIGALATPAVVAGTAFTAAASMGAASTSAGSVVTAMSTSKTSLTIAALVAAACLPLGYGARMGMESSPPPVASKPAPAAAKSEPVKKELDFKNTALYAEWRKLHDEHGTTADAMPALYKAITDIKNPLRRRVFRAAQIAEWAEIAPEAGLAFFMEKNRDSGQRDQFFNEWLQRDPAAAVTALLGSSGTTWESMARRSLVEIAKRVPGRVAEIAGRLPKSDSYWGTEVRDAFTILAAGGLDSARTAAEALTGPNREQALAGIAKAWAKTDVNAAITWAKALPEGVDRDEIVRGALLGLATTKPGDALDKVNSVPPGGRQAYFATTTGARVLIEAVKADYDATVAWLSENPGKLGYEDMMGMANAVTDRLNADPAGFLKKHLDGGSLSALMPAISSAILNQAGGQRGAIWEWIKTQPDTAVTRELRQQIISSAGYQDPDLAIKLVADMPQSKEGDESIRQLASSLMNGGQMLSRLDGLMEKAPERLRQPLLDSAFQYLNGENLDDPQKWISRAVQAPESQRLNFTSRIASAWAQQMPEEAVAWATSLSAENGRSGALSSIANAWANKDPYGASEWITSLPAGLDKDNAAASLVHSIASDSPAEAWEWALSIGNESTRKNTAIAAIDAMVKRDAATARQWVESGPFTDEEKTRMRTSLENGASLNGSFSTPARTFVR